MKKTLLYEIRYNPTNRKIIVDTAKNTKGYISSVVGMGKVPGYPMGQVLSSLDEEEREELFRLEYIYLSAFYQAKIIYNLGYPKNKNAVLSLDLLEKVVKRGLGKQTDCFQEAAIQPSIKYEEPEPPVIRYRGAFYAKGFYTRAIKTKFPSKVDESWVLYSAIAMIQHALRKQRTENQLEILADTVRGIVTCYKSGSGYSVSSIRDIPMAAFSEALDMAKERRAKEDIEE